MIRLEGTFTAMVTPFSENRVNETKLRELVDFQIENGKLEEALIIINGIASDFTAIEGYTYELDLQLSLEEIMAGQDAKK